MAGVAKLYRMRVGKSAPLVRVLNLHDVAQVDRLADMLRFLRAHYHVVGPEECFRKELDPKRINVLVTFDDGYASWVNVVLPALSSLHIKALFFVSSGLLDVHGDEAARDRYVKERLLISTRETLSWNGLRALQCAGHTIGGHTTSHARLSLMQQHELRAEVANDKRQIETMLGTQLKAFAYPFGEHATRIESIVRDAGYTYAFCNKARFARFDSLLRIPRLFVEDDTSIAELKHGIEGGCDVYERMKTLVRVTSAKTTFEAPFDATT